MGSGHGPAVRAIAGNVGGGVGRKEWGEDGGEGQKGELDGGGGVGERRGAEGKRFGMEEREIWGGGEGRRRMWEKGASGRAGMERGEVWGGKGGSWG